MIAVGRCTFAARLSNDTFRLCRSCDWCFGLLLLDAYLAVLAVVANAVYRVFCYPSIDFISHYGFTNQHAFFPAFVIVSMATRLTPVLRHDSITPLLNWRPSIDSFGPNADLAHGKRVRLKVARNISIPALADRFQIGKQRLYVSVVFRWC